MPPPIVLEVGYAFNSIPDLVGSPGNSAVKPEYFFKVKRFWEVIKTLALLIFNLSIIC